MASVADAASRLGIDQRTVRRQIASGDLLARKEGLPPVWVVDDAHLAQKEEALLNEAATIPVISQGLDASQAELMESQGALMKSLTGALELFQRPLKMLLDASESLLARSIAREHQLQEQVLRQWETFQLAMDRTAEREAIVTKEQGTAKRMEAAFDFVREQIPIALKYGKLAKSLPQVAPFILSMFPDDKALDDARENLPPEVFAGLVEIVNFVRAEEQIKAAKRQQAGKAANDNDTPPAEAPPTTEEPAT